MKVGDIVEHPTRGQGVIVGIFDDDGVEFYRIEFVDRLMVVSGRHFIIRLLTSILEESDMTKTADFGIWIRFKCWGEEKFEDFRVFCGCGRGLLVTLDERLLNAIRSFKSVGMFANVSDEGVLKSYRDLLEDELYLREKAPPSLDMQMIEITRLSQSGICWIEAREKMEPDFYEDLVFRLSAISRGALPVSDIYVHEGEVVRYQIVLKASKTESLWSPGEFNPEVYHFDWGVVSWLNSMLCGGDRRFRMFNYEATSEVAVAFLSADEALMLKEETGIDFLLLLL
ncbi:MAG: hypothetical protein R3D26_20415 [Cyanobacteriota/Melainabacteria group bacterium]